MPSAALSTASSPRYTDPAWKDSGLTLIPPMTATGDASPSMTPASSARDRRDMSHDTIRPAPTAASASPPRVDRGPRDDVHRDVAQGGRHRVPAPREVHREREEDRQAPERPREPPARALRRPQHARRPHDRPRRR